MDRLFPLVYDELHELAQRQLRKQRRNQTLDTTALLHEAYLKLSGGSGSEFTDRNHFFAVASTVMRSLVIDYARKKSTAKRGGGMADAPLDSSIASPAVEPEDLLTIDEALDRLGRIEVRLVRLVEMKFFGGLTVAEIAEVLGISERTVKRDWRKARALLYDLIGDGATA